MTTNELNSLEFWNDVTLFSVFSCVLFYQAVSFFSSSLHLISTLEQMRPLISRYSAITSAAGTGKSALCKHRRYSACAEAGWENTGCLLISSKSWQSSKWMFNAFTLRRWLLNWSFSFTSLLVSSLSCAAPSPPTPTPFFFCYKFPLMLAKFPCL